VRATRTVGLPLILTLASLPSPALAGDGPGLDEFRRTVRPVLVDRCLTCHAAQPRKAGLDLSQRVGALAGGDSGEALVPGRPEESLVFEKVAAGEMPPKAPLKTEQVEAFRAWIAAGAPYEGEPLQPRRAGPDWWSLRPVNRPAIPRVQDPAQIRTPLDAFILARLDAAGLKPAPEADRATLVRRLSFDLIGLPPTPEEVESFLADRAPGAYERLVDRLLASPHYGERWGRHWLDVVRFGESHGYEMNQPRPNAWPYRDYVIRSLNQDSPYPRFVAEQLAGDALPDADWLTQAATGFLVGGAHDGVGNATLEGQLQQRADDLDDMITATSTAFLGLTVACARCHDHKFDPITQRDYYGLQAVFAGVRHAERSIPAPDLERRRREAAPLWDELARIDDQLDACQPMTGPNVKQTRRPAVNPRRNVERFLPTLARAVRITIGKTNDGVEPCIDEIEVWTAEPAPRNVALAGAGGVATASSEYPNAPIHKIAHLNDGEYGNRASWISDEPGTGWAQIELAGPSLIDRIVWGRDRDEKYADRVAVSYRVEVAVEPGAWTVVASSEDRVAYGATGPITEGADQADLLRHRQRVKERLAVLGDEMTVYAGTFVTPAQTFLLVRGDPTRKGDEISPAGLTVLKPKLQLSPGSTERDRRLALAAWISDPQNPLPPRVLVNRLWHYHFGQGIVATPSDFGFNGDRPSHPELLDWLAAELLDSGGRLKPIHRLIVLSSTYRQSSRADESRMAVDRQNRLLWRMGPRRLEAEAIRDAVLHVSGSLDTRMGGPGYTIWEPNTNYVAVYKPKPELGPEAFRRMIYQFKPRSQPDPTFGAFDCADAGLVAPRRNVSTTPLQALNLLNSRFLVAQAEVFAERLKRDVGERAERQVERAFRLAFSRAPNEAELRAAVGLIRERGSPALCRALYNANEFVYVP
jgi:hypothetical protein